MNNSNENTQIDNSNDNAKIDNPNDNSQVNNSNDDSQVNNSKDNTNTNSFEADRTLASIVRIDNILPIPDADKIEIAEVKGWKCVVVKDSFKVGDLAVYYCEDSIPNLEDPNLEFLKNRGIKRIKIMKIRGIYSQGLLGPLTWMNGKVPDITLLKENDDVTKILQVKKYVKPEEIEQYMWPRGTKQLSELTEYFPAYVPKTDEERLQNNLDFLNKILNREIVITRKEDGCSGTFAFYNGKFSVCGRNFTWLEGNVNSSHYFHVEKIYDIKVKMETYGKNIALQGEIIGPKINGNKMGLTHIDYEVFNIYDIDSRKYLSYDEVTEVCNIFGIKQVPLLFRGPSCDLQLQIDSETVTFGDLSRDMNSNIKKILQGFLNMSNNLEYTTANYQTTPAEGLVVKTNDNLSHRVSFKVISQKFTLKYDK